MLEVIVSSKCKRDIRKASRRGKNMDKFGTVVNTLANQESLGVRHHDHALGGDYVGTRECHIEPDWLLVYKIDSNATELRLMRTGTHADLFGK